MEYDYIKCGDCLELMKDIPDKSINCVLTSPPYNTTNKHLQKRDDRGYDIYRDGMPNEEYYKWTLDIFRELERVLKKDGVILYNMSYGNQNNECMLKTITNIMDNTDFTMADIMVWKKPNCVPNTVSKNKLSRICEYVFVFCRRDDYQTFQANKRIVGERYKGLPCYETIFNFIEAKSTDKPTKLNHATFSTDFVTKLLNIYTHDNDIVLDPFMGTGTTPVGCLINNRHYIGFELSPAQFDYACARLDETKTEISNSSQQISMFEYDVAN